MVERVVIVRLDQRGDGIAESRDGPLYVPYTLPGETVEEGFLHSTMAGAFMLARNGFAGKLVPPELQAAIREMAATYSLDTHSRANEAALEIARRTGCMEYLIERIGGMIGPVDLTEAVQKLERRGVRNLLFVGVGEDKLKVIQKLAKDVVARRGGSGRSSERSARRRD